MKAPKRWIRLEDGTREGPFDTYNAAVLWAETKGYKVIQGGYLYDQDNRLHGKIIT